jgi:hypothetical protein
VAARLLFLQPAIVQVAARHDQQEVFMGQASPARRQSLSQKQQVPVAMPHQQQQVFMRLAALAPA